MLDVVDLPAPLGHEHFVVLLQVPSLVPLGEKDLPQRGVQGGMLIGDELARVNGEGYASLGTVP